MLRLLAGGRQCIAMRVSNSSSGMREFILFLVATSNEMLQAILKMAALEHHAVFARFRCRGVYEHRLPIYKEERQPDQLAVSFFLLFQIKHLRAPVTAIPTLSAQFNVCDSR